MADAVKTPALYDAHNHLQDESLAGHLDQIMLDLAGIGVSECLVNGTCEADWADVSRLCAPRDSRSPGGAPFPKLRPSFGLHPWDVGNRTSDWQHALINYLDTHTGAGVGEIGLDRWILAGAKPDDPRLSGLRRAPLEEQVEVFRWQLSLAAERNLPASIHCLDAFGLLLEVLESNARPARGFLLHAYSGSREMAERYAQLGAYFSFNGGFLDPRKNRLQELYAHLPFDRLLVETDAPAMRLPDAREQFHLPIREEGQPINHPANLRAAYTGLADLRAISIEQLASQVQANFERLFVD